MVTPRGLWVGTNDGWCFCSPHCGVWSGLGLLWVCCWSSGGGRVHWCMRGYSTSGTRLSPYCRRHRGCACWPRDLCGPHLTGHAPPGGVAPVVPQCGAGPATAVSWARPHCWCSCGCPPSGVWSRSCWVCANDGWWCGCPQCGVQRGGLDGSLGGVYGKAPAVSVCLQRVLCVKLLGRR